MGTYKEAFLDLVTDCKERGLFNYEFYDFAAREFRENAQSRICHISLNNECDYNKNAVLMVFTIGKNVDRIVIQSEGAATANPSSTYPQKKEAIRLAKKNKWKYIALAISSKEFPNDVIRDYVVSIESTDYAKATVCVIDDCIQYLKEHNLPAFYRCTQKANGIAYSLSFIKKDSFVDYLRLYDNHAEVLSYMEEGSSDVTEETINEDDLEKPINYYTDLPAQKKGFHHNWIVFGAPGTGKSFMINKEREELLKDNIETGYERVTFHPDYSYANFVGTYKPVPYVDSEGRDAITYDYVPGPFMRVLVKALENGKSENVKPFLLIIEEINRANVAAVFGDVFQLLDRDAKYVSEYPIQASEDMKNYLVRVLGGNPDDYAQIRIPDNMYIWATMNSADQGVFPMDTAFKRRWDFTYLGIDDKDTDIRGKFVYLAADKSQKVEWNNLRMAINSFLAELKINEDKQLGPYFISRSIVVPEGRDEIDRESFISVFKNKVIMYLFEDAAKQKRLTLFEGCSQSGLRYSEICKAFDEKGIDIFNQRIASAVKSDVRQGTEHNEDN